jgi:hypothetical protein
VTPEYRLTLIIETIRAIRAIRTGAPVSMGRVAILLEPWSDRTWSVSPALGVLR